MEEKERKNNKTFDHEDKRVDGIILVVVTKLNFSQRLIKSVHRYVCVYMATKFWHRLSVAANATSHIGSIFLVKDRKDCIEFSSSV